MRESGGTWMQILGQFWKSCIYNFNQCKNRFGFGCLSWHGENKTKNWFPLWWNRMDQQDFQTHSFVNNDSLQIVPKLKLLVKILNIFAGLRRKIWQLVPLQLCSQLWATRGIHLISVHYCSAKTSQKHSYRYFQMPENSTVIMPAQLPDYIFRYCNEMYSITSSRIFMTFPSWILNIISGICVLFSIVHVHSPFPQKSFSFEHLLKGENSSGEPNFLIVIQVRISEF